jgi:hypothetical protein
LINEVGPAIEEVAHEDQEVWFQYDGYPDSLREAIVVECRSVTERQLKNVTTAFYHMLGQVRSGLNQNGELLEVS